MLFTLQKYLFREWIFAFAGVAVILLLVVVGVYTGDMLGDVADGKLPAGLLWGQLFFRLPEALQLILPLSLFIAVMLGLGRLYRDNEMAVMRACGFRWQNMLLPLFGLSIPVALLLAVSAFWLGPSAVSSADKQLQAAFRSAVVWGLKPGQFHSLSGGQLVVYVGSMSETGDQFEQVFIYSRNQDRNQVWTAASGRYWYDPESGNRYITLLDGEVTESQEDILDYNLIEFSRADLKLPEQRQDQPDQDVAKLGLAELMAQSDSRAVAELHWRLSPAIGVLLLALLAIPLSHSKPRESRFSRLVLGLLVYAVYANLLTLGRVWLETQRLPAVSGLWWVHLGLLLLVLIWLRQQGRRLHI